MKKKVKISSKKLNSINVKIIKEIKLKILFEKFLFDSIFLNVCINWKIFFIFY